jgi:hypothetical protein
MFSVLYFDQEKVIAFFIHQFGLSNQSAEVSDPVTFIVEGNSVLG